MTSAADLLAERTRLVEEVGVAMRDAAVSLRKLNLTMEDFISKGSELDTRLHLWTSLFTSMETSTTIKETAAPPRSTTSTSSEKKQRLQE
jgi:hypothetical protein